MGERHWKPAQSIRQAPASTPEGMAAHARPTAAETSSFPCTAQSRAGSEPRLSARDRKAWSPSASRFPLLRRDRLPAKNRGSFVRPDPCGRARERRHPPAKIRHAFEMGLDQNDVLQVRSNRVRTQIGFARNKSFRRQISPARFKCAAGRGTCANMRGLKISGHQITLACGKGGAFSVCAQGCQWDRRFDSPTPTASCSLAEGAAFAAAIRPVKVFHPRCDPADRTGTGLLWRIRQTG